MSTSRAVGWSPGVGGELCPGLGLASLGMGTWDEDLTASATAILELLQPYFGRYRAPTAVGIRGAVLMGGEVPWYGEAKLESFNANEDEGWVGRVIVIGKARLVDMSRSGSDGCGARRSLCPDRRQAPRGHRDVGRRAAAPFPGRCAGRV